MTLLLRLAAFAARAAFAAAAGAAVTRLVSGAARGGQPAPPASAVPARDRGRMVRDPVCGVYVPKERAIAVVRQGREQFFCGEACARAEGVAP